MHLVVRMACVAAGLSLASCGGRTAPVAGSTDSTAVAAAAPGAESGPSNAAPAAAMAFGRARLVPTDPYGILDRTHGAGARATLVNVWATWCGPCRDEMPLLAGFAKAHSADATVAIVGIAQDDQSAVRSYLRLTSVNYPILFDDPEGRAGLGLGNRLGTLPYSVLLDADGRLLRRQHGPFASAKALTEWVSQPE